MTSRSQALAAIAVGDLIYGLREGGRPDLLLVYGADSAGFLARNVLNRATFRFARDGEGRRIEDGVACTIVSTARFPPDLYEVAIGLDRRMGSNPEYPDTRMTEDEIRLVLTQDQFFEARLLPGTESLVKRARKLRDVTTTLLEDWDPFHQPQQAPPSLGQYDDYVPALVDELEQGATASQVANLLEDIATRAKRPSKGPDRNNAAAEILVRLRQSWT